MPIDPKLNAKPSQEFVPIKEIRDGIVILKDDSLVGVIMTTSINLALKSEDEHNAIMGQFQSLLNSLEFSIQIVVQSRLLNIQPYLQSLEDRLKEQKEELLRIQTSEYIEYIKWFTENSNIMNKNFYVVVPYSGNVIQSNKKNGFFGSLFKTKKQNTALENERFEEKRSQLEQRMSVVQQGLGSMGIRNSALNTQQLIEMFYSVFNPEEPQKSINLNGIDQEKLITKNK